MAMLKLRKVVDRQDEELKTSDVFVNSAYLVAMEPPILGDNLAIGARINVGPGLGYSVLETCEEIAEMVEKAAMSVETLP